MESSSDVALYSGLAAGVVTVVLLIIAVTLYRRSQSEYGVDVIDSSALTGGFQSFSFKTSRQGEPGTRDFRVSIQNGRSELKQMKNNHADNDRIPSLERKCFHFANFKRNAWNDWRLEGFVF